MNRYFFASLWAASSVFAAQVYVSPSGSDTAAGTIDRPFATLDRARNELRRVRGAHMEQAGAMWLLPGEYRLDHGLVLDGADSGLIIRTLEPRTARLVNAKVVSAAEFRPVTNEETRARIAPGAQGKVLELDLKRLGIVHSTRYPNVFNDAGGLVSLYFQGVRMPLSRFPNQGYLRMRRVLDTGGGLQDRNWSQPTNVKPAPKDSGGTFEYREDAYDHFARWQKNLGEGVWLKGYWRIPWENEAVRLKSIDTTAHTATLEKAIPGGIGNKYKRPEGDGAEPYWLMNLLEEIDLPGEWAVDFVSQKLYFYPPAPLQSGEILLSDSTEPAIRVAGASNVVLRQLVIEGGLGPGVVFEGGSGNLLAGSEIHNLDGYAAVLRNGQGNQVLSCDLHHLGAGGVWLSGGDESTNPRVAAGHRVVNNHIHHFAELERVYAPGVNAGFTGGGGGGHHTAVGMLVAHNLIHDTPHAGVLYGSFDSTFEYNEVFRWCQVSNDMGAFYSYDLANRMGNVTFRYNLMHDSDEGDGLYWDHDHPDMHVYGNISYLKSAGKRGYGYLYKLGSQGKQPYSIELYNNVAVQCHRGFEIVDGLPAQSVIHDNVAVRCEMPEKVSEVKDGKAVAVAQGLPSGNIEVYDENPGFVDIAHLDFRLKPGARLLRDLPGFQPIPVERIGLFLDEYRRRLPSADEIDRFNLHTRREGLGSEILDRR